MQTSDQVIKKMHSHPFRFFGFYFFGVIIVALGVVFFPLAIALGVLAILLGEVVRRAETFYILDTGVAREYRLLSTSRKFIEYKNIQDIGVGQSFLERIFGIGSLDFDTSGSDQIEMTFLAVQSPYVVEKTVREKMALK